MSLGHDVLGARCPWGRERVKHPVTNSALQLRSLMATVGPGSAGGGASPGGPQQSSLRHQLPEGRGSGSHRVSAGQTLDL